MRNKLINLFFVASLILGVFTLSNEFYKAFLAPTDKVATTYTVQAGDTWYGICDKHYIITDNAECFNEFWYQNMADNGDRQLQPGDVVTITNKIYK